ncbi:MAG: ribonuclease III [Planctomycetaceae bacterium]|nr:ribonuclease III [Planctomycetaceae bacterium]MCA9043027.1 ribonuclease III [Planctomycetaceae bacterium]
MTRPTDTVLDLTDDMLAELERKLGHQFQDRELLLRCLTHASAARTRLESNERLEFLGDAILGSIVCEELFHRYGNSPEGELTRIKSVVVSRASCADIVTELGLDEYLVVGKGISVNRHIPQSVLATVYEALIGGLVLDGGYEAARAFILSTMDELISAAAESATGVNFKSLLQQQAQKMLGETPTYCVEDEKGPDHSKCFCVHAVIGNHVYPSAWGNSKKAAEQKAAENALAVLEGEEPPHSAAD